jgi:hypothetical protein
MSRIQNPVVTALLLSLTVADTYTAGAAVSIPFVLELNPEALEALDVDPDDLDIEVVCVRDSDGVAVQVAAIVPTATTSGEDSDGRLRGTIAILVGNATAGSYTIIARLTDDVELGDDAVEDAVAAATDGEIDKDDFAQVEATVFFR